MTTTATRDMTDNVKTNSRPSDLEITDLRMATIVGAPFVAHSFGSIRIREFMDSASAATIAAR